ncbi:EAL domain-containing protein [Blastococcus sp. CT_GayMR16]|uniref:putative bifunctional diguanylate cyclase/phosphodiesterase n=1 Tax=Blastococcus sp. CT_GayMR16 TaxID=2559607 RepID=UPI001FD7B9B7|nr:EAL domain-containing protein [Blastococcus sp. CT_GayMR16]
MRRGRVELPADVRPRDSDPAAEAALVRAVLDALPSPTTLIDADGTILLTNSAWDDMADLLGSDLLVGVGGSYFAMALHMQDDGTNRALIASLGELSRGERTSVSSDYALPHAGGVTWFHLQATRLREAGHVVVTHTDVTSRVRAERASTWRSRHDPLTELPNRARLHELIDTELRRPGRPAVTVLFLDVDGFKEVNDSLGHEVGDDLLRQLAARLIERTRAEDAVGRLGGDEFVVLCTDCDVDGAEALAERFRTSFDRPFDLGGRVARLTASIGVATAREGDSDVRSTDLVRDADLAMYAAKAAGRNGVRTFSSELRSAAQYRLLVAAELEEAIETGQLVLHYQPVLHLPTGQVSGVEVLVRWEHPERGLVPPMEFIPVAEQHGLIVPLTHWVLRTATRQTAEWARAGLTLITGVNISASHFATGTLVDDVAAALAAAGLPPEQLILELTETSVAEDPRGAAAQFAALRVSGVEVSIDDFGCGYSSLSQLVSMPAGVLKIDRSLVNGLDDASGQSAAAIAAVVSLGQACGMRSLAEGVETAGQLRMAAELGCTFAQGYYIARPMPADQLERWMPEHARQRAVVAGRA